MRRCEGACNRTGAPSVAFYESGGAGKRLDIFLGKEKRSKANFAPTWWRQREQIPMIIYRISTMYTVNFSSY